MTSEVSALQTAHTKRRRNRRHIKADTSVCEQIGQKSRAAFDTNREHFQRRKVSFFTMLVSLRVTTRTRDYLIYLAFIQFKIQYIFHR